MHLAPPQVPELNVQNGVLKALSFLFEYIGEMAKDYVYAITPLLIDALMERCVPFYSCHSHHQSCFAAMSCIGR